MPMQTCENCGTSFEPSDDVVEVTSLRILCPECTAARAAAKARKAAQANAAPAKPSAPGTRPKPAPAPAAARVPAPAPLQAARSAPAPAPLRKLEKTAAPAPMPAKKVVPTTPPKKKKVEIELHTNELKKSGTREALVAFGFALLVFVVAGLVLWKVMAKHSNDKAIEDARIARRDNFRTTSLSMPIDSEDGAKALIQYVEDPDNKKIWFPEDFAPDVISREAKAKDFLQTQEERRNLLARLAELEGVMSKAAELPPSDLAEARRSLDELAAKADVVGAEFVARLAKDRTEGERVYLERLESAAQAAAKAEPLDRAALTTIQQSEDEFLKIFEVAFKAVEKARDPELVAKKDDYQKRYQAIIALSDQAVERFFTPDVIENTPWRDLLAPDSVSGWRGQALKGFEHRIENGVLQAIGPDPSENAEGVLSIGDKEVWHDFEIELEVTIAKGECSLFFRLPIVYNKNTEQQDLTTEEGGLELGRTYLFTFRVLGSTLVWENKSEENSAGPKRENLSWVKPRKGAFGISIPKNTELKFTKLRARVLR